MQVKQQGNVGYEWSHLRSCAPRPMSGGSSPEPFAVRGGRMNAADAIKGLRIVAQLRGFVGVRGCLTSQKKLD